jgi:hypothetical protein
MQRMWLKKMLRGQDEEGIVLLLRLVIALVKSKALSCKQGFALCFAVVRRKARSKEIDDGIARALALSIKTVHSLLIGQSQGVFSKRGLFEVLSDALAQRAACGEDTRKQAAALDTLMTATYAHGRSRLSAEEIAALTSLALSVADRLPSISVRHLGSRNARYALGPRQKIALLDAYCRGVSCACIARCPGLYVGDKNIGSLSAASVSQFFHGRKETSIRHGAIEVLRQAYEAAAPCARDENSLRLARTLLALMGRDRPESTQLALRYLERINQAPSVYASIYLECAQRADDDEAQGLFFTIAGALFDMDDPALAADAIVEHVALFLERHATTQEHVMRILGMIVEACYRARRRIPAPELAGFFFKLFMLARVALFRDFIFNAFAAYASGKSEYTAYARKAFLIFIPRAFPEVMIVRRRQKITPDKLKLLMRHHAVVFASRREHFNYTALTQAVDRLNQRIARRYAVIQEFLARTTPAAVVRHKCPWVIRSQDNMRGLDWDEIETLGDRALVNASLAYDYDAPEAQFNTYATAAIVNTVAHAYGAKKAFHRVREINLDALAEDSGHPLDTIAIDAVTGSDLVEEQEAYRDRHQEIARVLAIARFIFSERDVCMIELFHSLHHSGGDMERGLEEVAQALFHRGFTSPDGGILSRQAIHQRLPVLYRGIREFAERRFAHLREWDRFFTRLPGDNIDFPASLFMSAGRKGLPISSHWSIASFADIAPDPAVITIVSATNASEDRRRFAITLDVDAGRHGIYTSIIEFVPGAKRMQVREIARVARLPQTTVPVPATGFPHGSIPGMQ